VGAAMLGRTPSSENLEQNNIYLLETGRKISSNQLLTAVDNMNTIVRRFAQFFEQYDIWLTPTMAEPPPRHGHLDANMADSALFFKRLWRFNTANSIYNVAGNPAISLPLHVAPNDLPIGVMLGSKFGTEALLISLASQLEKTVPWNNRHPNVSAWNLFDSNSSQKL
jgi:amidase